MHYGTIVIIFICLKTALRNADYIGLVDNLDRTLDHKNPNLKSVSGRVFRSIKEHVIVYFLIGKTL